MKITLKKPLKVKGKEVTTVILDFDGITGNDLIDAERALRALGDTSPSAYLSMKYHAILAARLLGVPLDDILEMNAVDFRNVTVAVAGFLLA
jgi:hypothetical protein